MQCCADCGASKQNPLLRKETLHESDQARQEKQAAIAHRYRADGALPRGHLLHGRDDPADRFPRRLRGGHRPEEARRLRGRHRYLLRLGLLRRAHPLGGQLPRRQHLRRDGAGLCQFQLPVCPGQAHDQHRLQPDAHAELRPPVRFAELRVHGERGTEHSGHARRRRGDSLPLRLRAPHHLFPRPAARGLRRAGLLRRDRRGDRLSHVGNGHPHAGQPGRADRKRA